MTNIADRVDIVRPNDVFLKILKATNTREDPTTRNILALDPGETTGVARWCGDQILLTQWVTKDIGQAFDRLHQELTIDPPDHLRYEDYKVYGWMAEEHSWASLHTPQWIGAIKVAAHLHHIPISKKLAQQAKAFWTDEKLKACNLYSAGLKHARDAERHLLFYMCFPDKADT